MFVDKFFQMISTQSKSDRVRVNDEGEWTEINKEPPEQLGLSIICLQNLFVIL